MDLNRDGRPDLIGYHYDHNELVVSFGHPDSLFTTPRTAVSSLLLRDYFQLVELTGDNNVDVFIGTADRRLFVFPGHGDGTFADAQEFSAPTTYGTLTFGDLNADGLDDIVVTGHFPQPSESIVLLNRGDLTFQESNRYPAEGPDAFVTLADVDGNGVTDILTWRWDTRLRVSLRDVNGDLLGQNRLLIPEYMRGFAVDDLDGDGDGDLVVINYSRATVFERLANGEIDSVGAVVGDQSHYTTQFNGVTLDDVDGDGDVDLILVCGDAMKNDIGVSLNNGDWQFSAPVQYDTATYYSTKNVAIGTINGDEARDLVVVASGIAHVLEGTQSGPDPFVEAPRISTDLKPWALALAEIHSDRGQELITSEWSTPDTYCLRTYDVSSREFHVTSETRVEHPIGDFEIIDLNGDPFPDIIGWWTDGSYTTGYESHAIALRGRWSGGFDVVDQWESGGSWGSIVVGDVDGDGNDDYVRAFYGSASQETVSLRVFAGDGRGNFELREDVPMGGGGQVYLDDLNRDGLDDVVLRQGRRIAVRFSSHHGLSEETSYEARALGLGIADVNGDGFTDIVGVGQQLAVLLGAEGNKFIPLPSQEVPWPYRPAGYPQVFPVDIAADTHVDLVVKIGGEAPCMYVLTGNGDGTFDAHPYLYESGFYSQPMAVGDLDADGALDAVSASGYGEPILVLWGLRQNGPDPNSATSPHIALRIAPNPFRASATFHYVAAVPGVVRATIFDVAGRRVAALVDDATDVGPRLLGWDGRTTTGVAAPAGVYFVEIRQGSTSGHERMIRLP